MDTWERFDETSLPDEKAFYSELNIEDIIDKDYTHAQNVFKQFKLKNPADYHDLYAQSDTLLLAEVFENFRKKCIEIYELDPANFLSAPGLAQQACLKKTEVELELLTNIDMLLMVAKGIRGGICHAIHRYAKANSKYMKNYDKNIISLYLMYLDANNFYGQGMSQKLPVNGFKWIKKLRKFDEGLIVIIKIVIRDILLKQMLNIQKNYLICIVIYHFQLKERKLKNVISFFVAYMIKKTMLFT